MAEIFQASLRLALGLLDLVAEKHFLQTSIISMTTARSTPIGHDFVATWQVSWVCQEVGQMANGA
jgi:hypothetical protein